MQPERSQGVFMAPVVSAVVPLQIVLSLDASLGGTLLPKQFDPSDLSLMRSSYLPPRLLDAIIDVPQELIVVR